MNNTEHNSPKFTLNVALPTGQSFLNEGGPDFTYGEVMDRMWKWTSAGFIATIEVER